MELPGKKIQDALERIKKNVEKSRNYFDDNYKRFNHNKKFVFVTALSTTDQTTLDQLGQPQIECNLLEAFVSRLRGEFSKQEPSMEVSCVNNANVDPQLIEVIEGHARYMECESRKNGTAFDVYTDLLSGGFSTFKLWTEYSHENSFEQEIRFGRVYDPTLCGFDPLARASHKGDGRYCFEIFPKTKEDFEVEYPEVDLKAVDFTRNVEGFSWSYTSGKEAEKILLMCDYYEKKKKKVKIVEIATTPAVTNLNIPKVMDMDTYKELVARWGELGVIEQPPAIENSRITERVIIVRYRFIQNKVLEYVETDYKGLPLIFVSGNSVILRDNNEGSVKEWTRSYIHNAIGTQKLANVALQSAGNELENMVQHKFIVAKEAIPEEYLSAYTDYQVPSVVVYNAFLDKEGVEPGSVALPPPREVARQPMPPEILNTLQLAFQLFQNILGSFDSSLGINNNQLSGIAIVEGATQSNAAAMPFVVGYMQGLNRLIELWIDLFPKYYLTPRSIPIMRKDGKKDKIMINQPGGLMFKYGENDLNVKVEAGPNYAIQKSKTLQLIMGLAQSMPMFAQFINSSDVLPTIVKLLDLPGAEQLQDQVKQFVMQQKQLQQQQMQAAMQPNPNMLKAQNEAADIQRETKKDQIMAQLKAGELMIRDRETKNDTMKLMLDAKTAKNEQAVEMDKHNAEKVRAFADMAMHAADMSHRHSADHHRLIMGSKELKSKLDQAKNPINTIAKNVIHEANESPAKEASEHKK